MSDPFSVDSDDISDTSDDWQQCECDRDTPCHEAKKC